MSTEDSVSDNFELEALLDWVQDLDINKNDAIFLIKSICDRFNIALQELED